MNKDSFQAEGLTRTFLALLLMVLLTAAGVWLLSPFLVAGLWSMLIVVSTWPLLLKVQGWFKGRRTPAVLVMTTGLFMMVILPLLLIGVTVAVNSAKIVDAVKNLSALAVPPPPAWLESIPIIGEKVVKRWQDLAAAGPEGLSASLSPYAAKAFDWLVAASGSIGRMLVQFSLTVFIAAIFYQRGDRAAAWLQLFARRIAGHFGDQAIILAGQAIRAVALGVIGTAVIQAACGWIGLAVCGVPGTGILTALIFVVCLARVGPVPVLLPVVLWLFWKDQTAWAVGLAAWGFLLTFVDNIVTPLLMKRGVDLPTLLVFAGVFGGLAVFGFVGLFVGPVVLAILYTLVDAWVTGDGVPEGSSGSAGAVPLEPRA